MKKIILAATLSALSLAAGYAQAATETQTFSQGLGLTDWSNGFNVIQFNSSLGTLNDVVLTFSGSSNITATLTNTGTKTATNARFSGTSLIDVNVGSAYSSEINASLSNFRISNIASGATASTGTQTTIASPDTQTMTSDLSSWIGTGSIASSYSTSTGFGLSGTNTSNVVANVTNYSGAQLTVTYNYTAVSPASVSAVPEADSYGMMLGGLGLLGFMVRRKKTA